MHSYNWHYAAFFTIYVTDVRVYTILLFPVKYLAHSGAFGLEVKFILTFFYSFIYFSSFFPL